MSSILTYALLISLAANGILAFLWQRSKRKLVEAISKGVNEARDVENKATEAMIEGLEDESKVTGSIDDGDFLN